jgi:predicted DNA-binding transcriptional regulator YafY
MSELETTLRHLAMLGHIPSLPHKITVGRLSELLKSEGFDIHRRSIERDLRNFSAGNFALTNDEAKPAGWSWTAEQERISFPPMHPGAALTWELVSRYLKPVLPHQMGKQLDAEFEQARRTLNHLATTQLGKWASRIAVLPQGHQLLPPKIRDGVSEAVYDALLRGLRVSADYLALGADRAKCHELSPQGLVYRQGVLYLVATAGDYTEVRQFALHRMANATVLDAPATPTKGFDLRRYVEDEKGFDLPAGKTIKLKLKVVPWLARHLDECKLAVDQVIMPIRQDERSKVTATLPETENLYWWLRSLGPDVEVLKPSALRKRIKGDLDAAVRMYA